jgi:hypothetical protein
VGQPALDQILRPLVLPMALSPDHGAKFLGFLVARIHHQGLLQQFIRLGKAGFDPRGKLLGCG